MSRSPASRMCLVCAVAALAAGSRPAIAQTASPPKPVSLGAQAVAVVLKHYALNPDAHTPATGLPLPSDGSWILGKARPQACPQTEERCVEVFYDVPAQQVRCSWVVALNADGADGQFLDENEDAATYLLRLLAKQEAVPLVATRAKPVYPPIAIAARVQGDVIVAVVVGKTGEASTYRILGGNAMLTGSALDAAKKWSFKPLTVGSMAISYRMKLNLGFHIPPSGGTSMATVTGDVAP